MLVHVSVQSPYDMVKFLDDADKKRPIVSPQGTDVGCV